MFCPVTSPNLPCLALLPLPGSRVLSCHTSKPAVSCPATSSSKPCPAMLRLSACRVLPYHVSNLTCFAPTRLPSRRVLPRHDFQPGMSCPGKFSSPPCPVQSRFPACSVLPSHFPPADIASRISSQGCHILLCHVFPPAVFWLSRLPALRVLSCHARRQFTAATFSCHFLPARCNSCKNRLRAPLSEKRFLPSPLFLEIWNHIKHFFYQ